MAGIEDERISQIREAAAQEQRELAEIKILVEHFQVVEPFLDELRAHDYVINTSVGEVFRPDEGWRSPQVTIAIEEPKQGARMLLTLEVFRNGQDESVGMACYSDFSSNHNLCGLADRPDACLDLVRSVIADFQALARQ